MNSLWRMTDANGNRAAEGLRVLEDLTRFVLNRPDLQGELRELRHRLGTLLGPVGRERLNARDAAGDSGFERSQATAEDRRRDIPDLAAANARRAAEAMRSLEESLKTLGRYEEGKQMELLRRILYDLEVRVLTEAARQARPRLPEGIYGITAEEHSLGRKNPEVVRLLVEGGVSVVQYREKEKPVREKLAQCREIRKITRDAGIPFIVNDDPLIALEVEADGIHIGQDDYPPALVRNLAGPRFMIGLSTHSPEQAAAALKEDIDYIGVGPIYPTQTKKDVCAAVGLEYLRHTVTSCPLPQVAIGGIKPHNLTGVIKNGARTVALVTALTGAEDIPRAVREIHILWEKTLNENR